MTVLKFLGRNIAKVLWLAVIVAIALFVPFGIHVLIAVFLFLAVRKLYRWGFK